MFTKIKESVKARMSGEKRDDEGITLIEIIVVVILIGILVAIAVVQYGNVQENARQTAVESSANSGLTAATAAALQGENPAEAVSQAGANSENITLTSSGTTNEIESLCVTASYVGYDNTAQAGMGCD